MKASQVLYIQAIYAFSYRQSESKTAVFRPAIVMKTPMRARKKTKTGKKIQESLLRPFFEKSVN